jgi:ferric-dicitrate binding protein FerR (iron transport regulator)
MGRWRSRRPPTEDFRRERRVTRLLDLRSTLRRGYDKEMGLNPFRQQKRRTSDYVLVAAAFAVVALLVLWAAGIL